jgi:hypothetical protein
MLEHSIRAHWHVMMSNIELVDRVELPSVESHCSHVVL